MCTKNIEVNNLKISLIQLTVTTFVPEHSFKPSSPRTFLPLCLYASAPLSHFLPLCLCASEPLRLFTFPSSFRSASSRNSFRKNPHISKTQIGQMYSVDCRFRIGTFPSGLFDIINILKSPYHHLLIFAFQHYIFSILRISGDSLSRI